MMQSMITRQRGLDGLAGVVSQVERRLWLALAVLLISIIGILGFTLVQPAVQYAFGPEHRFSAVLAGDGCGAHLDWEATETIVPRGSRVAFANQSVFWQIPVIIERKAGDGTFEAVAESHAVKPGEAWNYTFWRSGHYRVVSADDTQRAAGLETLISVR
jgi:hypothetical protein